MHEEGFMDVSYRSKVHALYMGNLFEGRAMKEFKQKEIIQK